MAGTAEAIVVSGSGMLGGYRAAPERTLAPVGSRRILKGCLNQLVAGATIRVRVFCVDWLLISWPIHGPDEKWAKTK